MSKKILYQDHARKTLEKGIDILAKAVSITLGPKGRNVVLETKRGVPQIINDGVTIAKEIQLKNHIENTGVALIRQVASKTNDSAGDGTTTATVLAHAMLKQGMKYIASGANSVLLKKGINKSLNFLINQLLDLSRPVESNTSITQVATIAAGNNVEIGTMIATAIEKVGREAVISLEESKSTSNELEITEGMQINKGFISPYFITDHVKKEVVQENPYILITDKKITLVQQELIPILEQITKTNRPLLIIAEDLEKEALATIIVNKLRGVLNVAAVKAPGFGDRKKILLEDIAITTNATVISENVGLSLADTRLDMLGQAKKIIITKDSTTIIAEGNEEKKKIRCNQIRQQINNTSLSYEKESLQERLAKLSGGIALIKVGAATETEMQDKKLRLEDAISATKSAIEEGVVPGGGSTLVYLSKQLEVWARSNLKDDELLGAKIVQLSLSAPLRKIAENAGQNGAMIIEKVQNSDFQIGYDATTGEFVNMYEKGIIDPTKVTRSAIQNAVSIVSMVLTTECIVVDQ
uniref:Chaperonin GroEL, chloroplastic n=1 Tax=Bulboplastis apyrenoidosa TaxID=1070855 RepID=A0A1X9PTP7_9RHOD|nr:60 kDa chaperone protein [Bulboplastis apyrenoidosa]ARO90839.1 60 kDa chaperone protein [Bulboplastis apyrenoidosa]